MQACLTVYAGVRGVFECVHIGAGGHQTGTCRHLYLGVHAKEMRCEDEEDIYIYFQIQNAARHPVISIENKVE